MEAKKISELIEKTGLTRQRVADELGVSTAQLRKYEHGYAPIPDARLSVLEGLAGQRPKLRPLGTPKPAIVAIADVPATVLIDELARRARAGRLREDGAAKLDAPRPLRSVAFTDVADD